MQIENENEDLKDHETVCLISGEEYNEYRTLLHEKDEAVAKVSYEYTEAALVRLNEAIEKLMDFRRKHVVCE